MSLAAICPCPICAVADTEPLPGAAAARTPLVRCRHCRYIFRARTQGEVTAAYLAADDERRLRLVERAVARGMLLDIGCGNGHLLLLAEQRGWLAAGVDSTASAEGVDGGDLWSRVRPALGVGCWPAGCFDAVTLSEPLTHCDDPREILRLAAYYCRKEGVLACTHVLRAPLPPPHTGDAERGVIPPYSVASLSRLLSHFGFQIERVESALAEQGRSLFGRPSLPLSYARSATMSPAQQRTLTPARESGILIIARRRLEQS